MLSEAQALDVQRQKNQLRLSMSAIRDALSPGFRAAAADAVARNLTSPAAARHLPQPGGVISGYIAIRSELDPLPAMRALRALGYRLALPHLEGSGMLFRAYEIGDRLNSGPLNTREPSREAPEIVPDLVLVPLLAFDPKSSRLGYGMGYYDRYFDQRPDVKRVGVAFACQEVAAVPCAPHDRSLDAVITEARMG